MWGGEQSPAAQDLGRDSTWALGGCPPGCPLAQERSDGALGQREEESPGTARGAGTGVGGRWGHGRPLKESDCLSTGALKMI